MRATTRFPFMDAPFSAMIPHPSSLDGSLPLAAAASEPPTTPRSAAGEHVMPAEAPEGHLRLGLFEGPLDLLLYLIRKTEIDVHDIPIVSITAQYQAMLEQLRRAGLLDLDFAGDYFLMAATLIQIKARMLLPRPAVGADGEPLEDPRQDLVRQLLEYERYREAAMMLREKADVASTMLTRPDAAVAHLHGGETTLDADLLALARAFRKVLEDRRLRAPHIFAPSRFSVRDRIQHVLAALGRRPLGEGGSFSDLFEEGTVEEAVVTFLAILELVKRGFVRCRQDRPGGDMQLELVPAAERGDGDALAPSEFDDRHVVDEGWGSGEGSNAPAMDGDEAGIPESHHDGEEM